MKTEDDGDIPEESKEGLVWWLFMSGCWWWKSQAAAAGLDLNMLGQCLLEDAMPERGAAAASTDDR